MSDSPTRVGFAAAKGMTSDVIEMLCAALPQLPSVIRFYDEFDDELRSIRTPLQQTVFALTINGRPINVDFSRLDERLALIFKHVFVFILGKNLSVATAALYISHAYHLSQADVAAILKATPTGISSVWASLRARGLTDQTYRCIKCLLQLLCAHRLFGWTNDYTTYIHTALPSPTRDAYGGVRSGEAFLSIEEEAAIVRHLDETVSTLARPLAKNPSFNDICDAGLLICAYQFAMRPIQIAMLARKNVRIWHEISEGTPTVHLTFHMAKQRSGSKRFPLTRRVKREWAPIFVAIGEHREALSDTQGGRYFPVQSSYEVGYRIACLVRSLIGSNSVGSATDLRHTAAQRLVDAGANHEELAAFLGHSQERTGLVYFTVSASHAERVNRALGASDVYQRVARIANDRFISTEDLAKLKDEQQIAGVPHGIPIAGIGGCSSGQPACPYNPVVSCYGCRKFMPLQNEATHEHVLASMRDVVLFFEQSSRGDTGSPAYLQLQRTIAGIQAVLAELRDKN